MRVGILKKILVVILISLISFVSYACHKNYNPTLSDTVFTFDKTTPKNIEVEMDLKGYEFVGLKNNSVLLDTSYYTYTSTKITILSGYFSYTVGDKTSVTIDVVSKKGSVSFVVNIIETIIKVESIKVESLPAKIVYYVGETLNTAGLVIRVSKNVGDDVLLSNGFSVSNVNTDTAGVKTVVVTYELKTTSFEITVNDFYLTGIKIDAVPTKLTYYVGDVNLSLSGLIVNAVYNNNQTQTLNNSVLGVKGFDTSTAGVKTITLSYLGFESTFEITVNNISLTAIMVSNYPSKVAYEFNSEFDSTGLVITALYNNGLVVVLEEGDGWDGYLLSGFDSSIPGNKTILVTYQDKTTSFSVTINNPSDGYLLSISVTKLPTKVVYYTGDIFNPNGLVISSLVYPSNTIVLNPSSAGDGYVLSCSVDLSVPFENSYSSLEITVTYQDKITFFSIEVILLELESISVIDMPIKTAYFTGEEFESAGLVVSALYNNGNQVFITSYVLSVPSLNTSGNKTITITYENVTTTFNITVNLLQLLSLEITVPTTVYYTGDTYSSNGLVVRALYNNGARPIISDYVLTNSEGLDFNLPFVSSYSNIVVTISYFGINNSFNITVVALEVVEIVVSNLPATVIYQKDQVFSSNGLVVSALYNNGESVVLSNIEYVVSVPDMSVVGNQVITVTYNSLFVTFEINILVSSLVGVNILSLPSKVVYYYGQPFESAGLVVEALFSDLGSEVVNNYYLSGYNPNVLGLQAISVTLNEFSVSFNVTVLALEVTSLQAFSSKTIWRLNEAFSSNNLVVKATYNSGLVVVLDNSEYSINSDSFNNRMRGTYSIVVSYSGLSTSYNIELEYEVSYYNNTDFHNYGEYVSSNILGQWPGYGIGDPFIMRFNGMYYLYASSIDTENGVLAWKSEDLINWEKCQGEGLPLGYVLSPSDYVSRAAYAPEVYYYNGLFYMYTSPAGAGHYIYTSENPEGPFIQASSNLGFSIDGSVLIDDDENMYFTSADAAGIRLRNMSDMLNISPASKIITSSSLGGWTEGPYILKKDGIYYLTYTGNHVTSDAYRIGYSYSTTSSLYSNPGFSYGIDTPILLNTESENFKGLGHSSTVLGPDLNSYYLAYHNLNSSGGPNRSLNIDRILFNGSEMVVSANEKNSIKPSLSGFYARDRFSEGKFLSVNNLLLSNSFSQSNYTAEFNFKGEEIASLYAGYIDSLNYVKIVINFNTGVISINEVIGGISTVIGSVTLNKQYSKDVLHTVRLENNNSKFSLYFDNMRKLYNISSNSGSGMIGYDENLEVGYSAISNVSGQMSDYNEYKQYNSVIPASLYYHHSSYSSSVIVENASSKFENASQVSLNAVGAKATYFVNFNESGFYGLTISYPYSSQGKKIGIKVDNSDVMMVTLPIIEGSSPTDYISALVSEFNVSAGINQIRIENVGQDFKYVNFTFFKSSEVSPLFSDDLSGYMALGADYKTIWKLFDSDGDFLPDSHRATAGTIQLVYIGDSTITDFVLDIDIRLVGGGTSTSTAGIVFRASNSSIGNHDTYQSISAYYMSLNAWESKIQKLNYNLSSTISVDPTDIIADTWVHLKIVAVGAHIVAYIDGVKVIDFYDIESFTHGKLGLYTNGQEALFKNLVITPYI
ncbi:MAG: bacterial Ig-like domain-containing protein [Acholeplasmatales bacterium]|jgi:hypothetical protein|nr:bacterial Ig-like domain-containing protein [Acholeplasmatales bacterium]